MTQWSRNSAFSGFFQDHCDVFLFFRDTVLNQALVISTIRLLHHNCVSRNLNAFLNHDFLNDLSLVVAWER